MTRDQEKALSALIDAAEQAEAYLRGAGQAQPIAGRQAMQLDAAVANVRHHFGYYSPRFEGFEPG